MRWGGHDKDAAGGWLQSGPPRTSLAASSPPCGRHAGYQQLGHGGLSPDSLSPSKLGWRSLATAVGVLWPCWRVQMS